MITVHSDKERKPRYYVSRNLEILFESESGVEAVQWAIDSQSSASRRKKMNEIERKQLYKRLAYIAENCEQNDPADKEMWAEYRRIKRQLGIPNYHSSKPKANQDE